VDGSFLRRRDHGGDPLTPAANASAEGERDELVASAAPIRQRDQVRWAQIDLTPTDGEIDTLIVRRLSD
jgi:hypothetical protein